MSDHDKLYQRLKALPVPPAANPEHEARLRQQLEKIVGEPLKKPAFILRPAPVFAGGLALAVGVVIALVLILRPFGDASIIDLAAAQKTPTEAVAMFRLRSGEVNLVRGESAGPLVLGGTLKPGDRVTVAAGARAELQIDERAFVSLDPGTAFVYRGAWAVDDGKTMAVEINSGAAYLSVRGIGGPVVVYTPYAVFQTVGTEFMVKVETGKSAVLAVGEGRVRVLSTGPRARVLRESVRKGGTVTVEADNGLVKNYADVSEAEAEAIANSGRVEMLPTASGKPDAESAGQSLPVTVSVRTEPANAFVAVDSCARGAGAVSFLALPNRRYSVFVSFPGYETQALTMDFREKRDLVFRLQKSGAQALTVSPQATPSSDAAHTPQPVPTPAALVIPKASPEFTGRPADWTGIAPLLNDPKGDARTTDAGSDVSDVFLARDQAFFYIGIKLENGSPDQAVLPEFAFTLESVAGRRLEFTARTADRKWTAAVKVSQGGNPVPGADTDGEVVVGDAFVEMKLPILAALPLIAPEETFRAGLTVKVLKFGRLRVVADEAAIAAIAF